MSIRLPGRMGGAVVNRAQLVEKAALASHRWGLECGGEHAEWDALRESVRRDYRSEAAAVVDALLPQVTTVEELEALPDGAVVVYGGHRVYRWRSLLSLLHNIHDGYDYDPEDVLWPLTIVWQP